MQVAESYRRQVALLMRVLPFVAEQECFALKGGTAINLFLRDLPRLSVDIDLTYLPVAAREESLRAVDEALRRILTRLDRALRGARITPSPPETGVRITKLLIRLDGVQVKVEVTPVLRGCVYEPELRTVSPQVEELFGFAEMLLVSFADLYAGKIVAALDRQHPRDLFDVGELLANEGVGDALRTAFLVYLVSHNRPMAEVLAPARKDIAHEFARGFEGMSPRAVSCAELAATRERLIDIMVTGMPARHRQFLLSVKAMEPDWALVGVPGVDQLPAVQWRLANLGKMDRAKRALAATRLTGILNAA